MTAKAQRLGCALALEQARSVWVEYSRQGQGWGRSYTVLKATLRISRLNPSLMGSSWKVFSREPKCSDLCVLRDCSGYRVGKWVYGLEDGGRSLGGPQESLHINADSSVRLGAGDVGFSSSC